MVLLLNGELSDGSANKRPLENGYYCSNSGNIPKYKSRKISAARDFPPMCGRRAQSVESELEENRVASVSDNAVKTETGIPNQAHEVVKCPVMVDANETGKLTDGVQTETGIETAALKIIRSHVDMNAEESRMPFDMEERDNVFVSISDGVCAALEANIVKFETTVEIQSHEVVGISHGLEGAESLDKLVENVGAGFTDGKGDGAVQMVLDVKPMGIELAKDLKRKCMDVKHPNMIGKEVEASIKKFDKGEGLPVVKGMGEDGVKRAAELDHLVLKEVPVKDEAVSSPKNKYRRRRVSVIRDFPPYCGRNVLSVQENIKIISGENLQGVNKINMENGMVEASKGGVDSKKLKDGEISMAAKVEAYSLEQLGTSLEVAALVEAATVGGGSIKGGGQDGSFQESQARGVMSPPRNISDAVISKDNEERESSMSKEPVLFAHDNTSDKWALDNGFGSGDDDGSVIVTARMAATYCPWSLGKLASNSRAGVTQGKINKDKSTWQAKSKIVSKRTVVEVESSGKSSKGSVSVCNGADGTLGAVVVKDEGSCSQNEEPPSAHVDLDLPPFGPSLSHSDARKRVRETLRLFQVLCRKLLQGEESRPEEDTKLKQSEKNKRIDLQAAKIIKERGKEVNTGKQWIGAVPGVEVGDEFQYRVELAIVGVHRLYQAGIDSMKHNGMLVATSIVASGSYDDDMENADVLIYSGQGGNIVGKNKQPEDQKLEKGNLALWNSISTKNPVRVIRGSREAKVSDSQDSRVKLVTSYIYDGLYTVENCRQETGTHSKLVFMFELKRIPGQPELTWKEVKKSRKSRVRYGVCIDDISGGEELLPICAVNTIDDGKPQQFHYIRKMMYPDWFYLLPPKGCDCVGRCSDARKCSCAQRNGGEIPYNRNGAIVEAKSLVYECGPHCKCPPSCYNRVSQHGIKVQLEIFKTKSRGWGVRSLYSIASGSFICEYVGELLDDNEAELRAGSDEYLFDIGKNYRDSSLNPDGQGNSFEAVEEGGYTIDAAKYGNIGRFVNHSCSPNLYAQDVLYDHDDKRMPHVMLFAAENIPPLQELTYHYNYIVGQVHDSSGNIKMKRCYCGSTECTGRMY